MLHAVALPKDLPTRTESLAQILTDKSLDQELKARLRVN